MNRISMLGASAVAMAAAGGAHAATLIYTLTGLTETGEAANSRWTMDSNPTVSDDKPGVFFEVDDLHGDFNYGSDFHRDVDNLSFYHLGTYVLGFSTILDSEGVIDLNGPQLYTGSELAPTMRTGEFELFDYFHETTFHLSVTPVPEPVSWALMIGGIGVIGGVLRARRTSVSFA